MNIKLPIAVLVSLILGSPLIIAAQPDRTSPQSGKRTEAQPTEKPKKPSTQKPPPQPPEKPSATASVPQAIPLPATPLSGPVPVSAAVPAANDQSPKHSLVLWGIAGLVSINTLLLLFILFRSKPSGTSSGPLTSPSPNNQDDLGRLSRAFAGLHEALDKKDEEIRRHQKGYDHKILKTLLGRLVQVQLFLEGALSDKPPTQQGVQSVADELAMVLEEYGIRTHEPKGEPYRTTPGVATNPKTVPTDRADLRGRIAEVRQKGFFLKTPAGDEVLLPAKVTIYE